jgi:hypothetical protein
MLAPRLSPSTLPRSQFSPGQFSKHALRPSFRPVSRQPETALKTSPKILFDSAPLRPKRRAAARTADMVDSVCSSVMAVLLVRARSISGTGFRS